MTRSTDRPYTKKLLRLYSTDVEEIQRMADSYPEASINFNHIVREAIHTFVIHSRDIQRRVMDRERKT